ncbi:MAG TPA: MXAN_6640 family putative metalloprotease [Solirubrobacterales bacterium]|nr:MXAN_6640 family putative metalloprotease [Solirubrobacterales bacterium]
MRAARGLIGAALASLALLALAPGSAAAAADHLTFIAPAPRPTDHPDPDRHAYSVPEAPQSPFCTAHFCVHWVTEGLDAPEPTDLNGNGIPDFVEEVGSVAEHVYAVENEELGWRPPKSDGRRGGGNGNVDVYLKELGAGRLFGYAAPDRPHASGAHPLPRRLDGYMVLDNNYSPFEFPHTMALSDLEVTFAHEYDHVLQFGYDAYQDPWFAESTAVWMEDRVYDGIDDYLRYVRRWVHFLDTPLTASSIKEYGSTVWNEWLARRYGPTIVRAAWERAIHVKPAGFSVAAYDAAIRAAGGPGFDLDFARFARDLAEWRTGRVFREGRQYPDVPRQGSLPRDGRSLRLELNHTTFRLLRVHGGGARAVRIAARAPRGVAAGLALVDRIGSERDGRVVSRLDFAPRGGALAVRLSRPGRFQRITAVLVNAETREDGFSARRVDWSYLAERARFVVRARFVR